MKEFKGTIGKWNITTSKKGNHYMNVGGNCEFIKVYSGKRSGHEVNQKANALLISKAPEMLDMLIDLRNCKETWSDLFQSDKDRIELLIREATEL